MMKAVFLLAALLSLLFTAPASAGHHKSDHFFYSHAPQDSLLVEVAARPEPSTGNERQDCEAHLKKRICETREPADSLEESWASVKCVPSSAQYLPILMKFYDEMPEKMRPTLCSLERVFFMDELSPTAFASAVAGKSGNVTGGYVGFSRKAFLNQPSSHDIVTWKEQKAFGGSNEYLANDPKLVQIYYGLKTTNLPTDGLFYVFVHELGHLIDAYNGVNDESERATAWSKLSWKTFSKALPGAAYALQSKFCVYECSQFLAGSQAYELYTSLPRSAFLTTYSGTNTLEDFAEFWAWYVARNLKGGDYRIVVPGWGEVQMNTAFTQSPKIAEKIRFIEKLWNSPKTRFRMR